jgi:hypothetical protein
MRKIGLVSIMLAGTLASAPAGAATVTGKSKVVLGGQAARCVGVALIPRTAVSERQITNLFGDASEPAVRNLTAEDLNSNREADADRDREGRCYWGSYSFRNVPAGDYFVTMMARGGRGGWGSLGDAASAPVSGFREQVVLLMQPVRVSAAGTLVQADFEHK